MSETPLTNELGLKSFGGSAGALLRQAREAAGMHIGALAVSLKVPVKKIEALEADRLDLLPDAVFARALASSICRTLKVDAGPILASLPQGLLPRLRTDEGGLNAVYQASGVVAPASMVQHLSKPLVLIGLGLVAAAAFLLIAPGSSDTSRLEKGPESALASQADLAPAKLLPVQAASSPIEGGALPLALVETKAIEKPDATAQPGLAEVSKLPNTGPETGTMSSDGVVVFRAKGVAWVEVTDAAGVVQLRKTLAPGETAGVSGQSPFKVIVGRADSVDVKVRGKGYDLGPVSRDNVARFEVR